VNRETIQSLTVIVAIVVAALILWYIGSTTVALVLATILVTRLIDLLVVGKKGDEEALSNQLLMKSLERHSEDLRRTSSKWAEQLPLANGPQENIQSIISQAIAEPKPICIAIESEPLFEDLANHTPKEIPLADRWSKYKTRLDGYNKKRFLLLSHIGNEVSIRTGLNIDPSGQHALFPTTVRVVYNHLFDELSDQSHYWKECIEGSRVSGEEDTALLEARDRGIGLAIGSRTEMRYVREILVSMASNIRGVIGEPKYSDWKKRAEELLSEKKALDGDAHQLLHEIKDFDAIPIVSGKCKYVMWNTKR
jgi:hypothetical protein